SYPASLTSRSPIPVIPDIPVPGGIPSQAEGPNVPIVRDSRTTCIVRVGSGIGGCRPGSPGVPDQGVCSAGGRLVPPRLAEQERAMRQGVLGSIAARAAGAGAAWGQAPTPLPPIGDPPPPAAVGSAGIGSVVPASGTPLPPVIMPPMGIGPP